MYHSRSRQRVHAIRRAPDGSAFQKCDHCGILVTIALADMHECELKNDVKRFKRECGSQNLIEQRFQDQPRSEFRFFMESFMKTCKAENEIDIDRKGFETWKNMSKEERRSYVLLAEKVNSAYTKALLKEENGLPRVEDEADSGEVGKSDVKYDYYDNSEYLDDSESFYSETSEH